MLLVNTLVNLLALIFLLIMKGVRFNMGKDPRPDNLNSTTSNVAGNFKRNIPKVLAAMNLAIAPNELAKLGAAQQVIPGYTQLANQVNNATTINDEALNLGLLDTVGREKSRIATEIDKGINPEFYQAKPEVLSSILSQIKALDLNKPNIEAERLVNAENVRSGNAGNNSGTTGVANALMFENEKLKRSAALTSALNTANGFLTSSRATFDPFGRSTVSDNTGSSGNKPNIASTFQSIGDDTLSVSDNFLSGTFGLRGKEADIKAGRRDPLDRTNETMSSQPIHY
jgi:hypothetical protein